MSQSWAKRALLTPAHQFPLGVTLALSGLGWFAGNADADARAGLVIGYARPPEHTYTTAIARLCAVLSS